MAKRPNHKPVSHIWVSPDDQDLKEQYNWSERSGRATAYINGGPVTLHRLIAARLLGVKYEELDNGHRVAFHNGNPLDCRRDNLSIRCNGVTLK